MLVVDIEATGPDVNKNSILSIGALDFSNPNYQFYGECRMRKGALVDPVGLKISGFTLEQANDKSKMTDKQLLKKFISWAKKIEDRTLAGQIIMWDKQVLETHFKKHKLHWIFSDGPKQFGKTRVIDLHAVAYAAHLKIKKRIPLDGNMSGLSLNTILRFVGLGKIAKERRALGVHNSMDDTKLEAEAFSRILHGKSMFKEYKQYPLPKYLMVKKKSWFF